MLIRLRRGLQCPRPANLMCVVLADQENLMQLRGDDHPHPNIDVSFVKFTGREVEIPTAALWSSHSDCKAMHR